MSHNPSLTKSFEKRTSIKAFLCTLFLSVIVICGIAISSTDAVAQSLDAARSSGMVGEQSDGYAVARKNATAAARKLVNRVNSQRRKIYTRRGREQRPCGRGRQVSETFPYMSSIVLIR